MSTQQSSLGKGLAVTGALLQAGPIFSLFWTVIGILMTFGNLGSKGTSDPGALARNIGLVLFVTAAGMGLGLIGVVLLFIALFGCDYRDAWFFWFLIIYGGMLLFLYPFGSVIGVVFLIVCLIKRDEFLSPRGNQPA